MSCKVIFTDTAKSDLLEIARGIAELSKGKALPVPYSFHTAPGWPLRVSR